MTQENEIKRPTQDLEHEPIKQLDNSEKGGKVSQALETVTTTAEKVQRQPVIAHLIRATERFNDRLGNQFGAAITYFSFLSMIPILMVSFAAGGFVLASHPMLLQDIFDNSAKHQRSDASRHIEKHHQHRRSAAYDCRACRSGSGTLFRHQLDG